MGRSRRRRQKVSIHRSSKASKEKGYSCSHCRLPFTSPYAVHHHILEVHPRAPEPIPLSAEQVREWNEKVDTIRRFLFPGFINKNNPLIRVYARLDMNKDNFKLPTENDPEAAAAFERTLQEARDALSREEEEEEDEEIIVVDEKDRLPFQKELDYILLEILDPHLDQTYIEDVEVDVSVEAEPIVRRSYDDEQVNVTRTNDAVNDSGYDASAKDSVMSNPELTLNDLASIEENDDINEEVAAAVAALAVAKVSAVDERQREEEIEGDSNKSTSDEIEIEEATELAAAAAALMVSVAENLGSTGTSGFGAAAALVTDNEMDCDMIEVTYESESEATVRNYESDPERTWPYMNGKALPHVRAVVGVASEVLTIEEDSSDEEDVGGPEDVQLQHDDQKEEEAAVYAKAAADATLLELPCTVETPAAEDVRKYVEENAQLSNIQTSAVGEVLKETDDEEPAIVGVDPEMLEEHPVDAAQDNSDENVKTHAAATIAGPNDSEEEIAVLDEDQDASDDEIEVVGEYRPSETAEPAEPATTSPALADELPEPVDETQDIIDIEVFKMKLTWNPAEPELPEKEIVKVENGLEDVIQVVEVPLAIPSVQASATVVEISALNPIAPSPAAAAATTMETATAAGAPYDDSDDDILFAGVYEPLKDTERAAVYRKENPVLAPSEHVAAEKPGLNMIALPPVLPAPESASSAAEATQDSMDDEIEFVGEYRPAKTAERTAVAPLNEYRIDASLSSVQVPEESEQLAHEISIMILDAPSTAAAAANTGQETAAAGAVWVATGRNKRSPDPYVDEPVAKKQRLNDGTEAVAVLSLDDSLQIIEYGEIEGEDELDPPRHCVNCGKERGSIMIEPCGCALWCFKCAQTLGECPSHPGRPIVEILEYSADDEIICCSA